MTSSGGPRPGEPPRSVEGAGAVRDEDALDVAAVAAWIRANAGENRSGTGLLDGVDLGTDDRPVLPEIRQFTGGASNLTYLLRYPDVDLILRRPPRGTRAGGAHDMRREHDVQQALRPVFPMVPRMIGFCDDPSMIGTEFYVMEKLEGTILRRDIPDDVDLDVLSTRLLCERAVDTLAALHRIDPAEAGLGHLDKGDGYVRRQVEGWTRRFRAARTPDTPDYTRVMRWLETHQPPDVPHRLIHNDYRFDNLVLSSEDPTRIVGVLDWEMATVGDPLMDLGGAMAYWVEAQDPRLFRALRRQPTHTMGMLTRREFVFRYCRQTGFLVSAETWKFYHVFGLFRLAVIIQQIHYRYFHGQTTNPAFARFGFASVVLEQMCFRAMRGGGHFRRVSTLASASPRGIARALPGHAASVLVDSASVLRPLAAQGAFALARRVSPVWRRPPRR